MVVWLALVLLVWLVSVSLGSRTLSVASNTHGLLHVGVMTRRLRNEAAETDNTSRPFWCQ